MVDFGVVQPGDWEFTLTAKPETAPWYATGTLNVLPGTTIEKNIICPEEQTVRFRSLRVARQRRVPTWP